VQLFFRQIFKNNIFFFKTILIIAQIMCHFKMRFKSWIPLIKSKFILFSTNLASQMIFIHMFGKHLLIIKILLAKLILIILPSNMDGKKLNYGHRHNLLILNVYLMLLLKIIFIHSVMLLCVQHKDHIQIWSVFLLNVFLKTQQY